MKAITPQYHEQPNGAVFAVKVIEMFRPLKKYPSDHQNKATDLNEELQSPYSSSSCPFFVENEDQDRSGTNLKYYAVAGYMDMVYQYSIQYQ